MTKNKLAQVFHFDLYGKREAKYDFLNQNTLRSVDWNELQPEAPNFFLVKKDNAGQEDYEKGFKVDELFLTYNNGIETGKDSFFYDYSLKELKAKIEKSFEDKEQAIRIFSIENTSGFPLKDKLIFAKYNGEKIRKVNYRPFDLIYSYYDEKLQRRPAYSTMKNMFYDNIGLLVPRQFFGDFKHVFVSKFPTDGNLTSTAKKFGSAPLFPLYLYPETSAQQGLHTEAERVPNLNMEIVEQIAKGLGLLFIPEAETGSVCYATNNSELRNDYKTVFTPLDLLDYIYAVLHSPTYREKYKEFLKIDFPRVPYPKDADTFWKLVKLGGAIRQIHLLESPVVERFITQYPVDGDNVVGKPCFDKAQHDTDTPKHDTEKGRVYINETQYFDQVPEVAWNFYIGGYQPAQKWLKDRKDRALDFEDILHYQKIIVALSETERLMKEIDKSKIE
ncbi:MAG: hypothetical protein M9958_03550 [Chitinophagales bacterium]|nr:hypothetical protein [Chitinophagales bacterium]